jgi:hypothetical protein
MRARGARYGNGLMAVVFTPAGEPAADRGIEIIGPPGALPGRGVTGGAIRRLADDVDAGRRIEDHAEALAHYLGVIGDEDANAHAALALSSASGTRATTWNPPPGRGPASSSPP